MLIRGGRDPFVLDRRPLSVIMNDEIPYDRFDRELKELQAKGFDGWPDYNAYRLRQMKRRGEL